MRLRFKSLLMFIFIMIIGCLSIGVGYFFYVKYIKENSTIIVDGNLTFNYINGNTFSKYKNKQLKFSVTNNSDEDAYYYLLLNDIKGKNKSVTYELRSNNDTIKISDKLRSEIIYNSIMIKPHATQEYAICFKTINNKNYKGKIIGKSKLKNDVMFADIILENNPVNESALSKIGDLSILDEGLQKSKDDIGTSYYFRGNVKDNYVSFAGFLWRIVRINGDGSVKIVLNDAIDVLNKYYDENYEYSKTQINKRLQSWYQEHLFNYGDYIASHKFCNDNVKNEETGKYASYDRIITNHIPTFVCLGKDYNLKIGLLTADEVMLAGAGLNGNKEYYLYNENIKDSYFTMTIANYENNKLYPFVVKNDGSLDNKIAGNLNRYVRPVINLIKNVNAEGNGTINNPYQIKTK